MARSNRRTRAKWGHILALLLVLVIVPGDIRAGQAPSSPGPTLEWGQAGEAPSLSTTADASPSFTFAVVADMRSYAGPGPYDTPQYFRGAVEAIAALGTVDFIVSPGDIDPPGSVLWTITHTLGVTYTWYPMVGNHELPGAGSESGPGENLRWLNRYDYGSVNPGPAGCPTTTYSFDYDNAHLIVLNEYCDSAGDDVTAGDIPDHLYDWLVADLDSTDRPHVFVFGHEPAYPQPDADNGRVRHLGDSLDQYPAHRDRFWSLLRERGVRAYVCGHTHNYSAIQVDGVWQLDAGHARGLGDTGARSTFVIIRVDEDVVRFTTYRDDAKGGPYEQAHGGYLLPRAVVYLPLVLRASTAGQHTEVDGLWEHANAYTR